MLRDEAGRPRHRQGVLLDITERKKAEQALREAETRYRTLVEQIPAVTYMQEPLESDDSKAIIYMSPQYETMLGYPADSEVIDGEHWLRTIHPEDRERVLAEEARTDETGEPFKVEYRMVAQDGRVVWVRDQATLVRDEENRPLYWLGVQFDVTERKEAERALLESEERFRYMVHNSSDIMTLVGADGTVRYVSPAIERVLGHRPEGGVGGNVFELVHPNDVARARRLFAEGLSNPGVPLSIEVRMRHKDGSWRDVEVTGTNLLQNPGAVVLITRDVTERKALEEELQHQAFHDTLTSLPNRALFSDRLRQAVARTQRHGGKVAVLFMDLDNFKIINDSLGHDAGDELLVGVAERLRACLRPEDTAARLGGDEFAVLLEGLGHVDEATRVAKRIADTLRVPFDLAEGETFVTTSIGVAIGGATGATKRSGDLLRDADLAMYRAKQSGKARYAVFEEAMSARALERLELTNDLRRALERGEFAIHYQPKVSLTTGRTVGFEALVRWEHPERGGVLPDRFVPLAEETGLIVSIGRWVLREACTQAKEWQRRYPSDPPLVVCVNLSARQLRDPDHHRGVGRILNETGLEPSSLNLEITESVAMEDAPATAAALEELHALGVRVTIDDFGTGYSSLSYLERFPVDYAKIDRSFVGKLEEETGARVLVKGMIDLVHALGLGAIAEGVETAGQLERLRGMGCDMAQGHYFSRPLPSEAAATLLEHQHP